MYQLNDEIYAGLFILFAMLIQFIEKGKVFSNVRIIITTGKRFQTLS